MPHTHHSPNQPPSHVTVTFEDGAHSFLMGDGATLAELAKRIRVLGILHDGSPISIDVEFKANCSPFIVQARHRRPLSH